MHEMLIIVIEVHGVSLSVTRLKSVERAVYAEIIQSSLYQITLALLLLSINTWLQS